MCVCVRVCACAFTLRLHLCQAGLTQREGRVCLDSSRKMGMFSVCSLSECQGRSHGGLLLSRFFLQIPFISLDLFPGISSRPRWVQIPIQTQMGSEPPSSTLSSYFLALHSFHQTLTHTLKTPFLSLFDSRTLPLSAEQTPSVGSPRSTSARHTSKTNGSM